MNFRKKIEGHWWDKVYNEARPSIGFKTITADKVYNSIILKHDSFSQEGKLIAQFENQFSRIIPEHNKVIYYWQGTHPTEANTHWSGYGDLDFYSEDVSCKFLKSRGKFFNINEFTTDKWEVKTTDCKRERTRKK